MTARVARSAGIILALLALDYLLLVGIGLLLTKVLEKSSLIHKEDAINRSLADGRTPRMNDVTYLLSGLGNTGAIIGALIVVAVSLVIAMKRWAPSIFLVVAVSGQALVFLLVTLTISRQRPDVKRLDASPPTSSFPSGHTGAATALFIGSACLVLWYVQRTWVKVLGMTLLIAVPLLVAYGRLLPRDAPPDRRPGRLPQRRHLRRDRGGRDPRPRSAAPVRPGWWCRARPSAGPRDDGGEVRQAAVVYNPTKVPDLPALQKRVETFMSRHGLGAAALAGDHPGRPRHRHVPRCRRQGLRRGLRLRGRRHRDGLGDRAGRR